MKGGQKGDVAISDVQGVLDKEIWKAVFESLPRYFPQSHVVTETGDVVREVLHLPAMKQYTVLSFLWEVRGLNIARS